MGMEKVEVKRIENAPQRQASFYKRREGLLKTAKELSILRDANVLLIVFSSCGKLHEFHHPLHLSARESIEKYEMINKANGVEDTCMSGEDIIKAQEPADHLGRNVRYLAAVESVGCRPLPTLNLVEQNLEAAIGRARREMDSRIKKEMANLAKKEHLHLRKRPSYSPSLLVAKGPKMLLLKMKSRRRLLRL